VGACCYKSAPSKIRPSTIFGDRNVCYGSAEGKADFVATIAIGDIYIRRRKYPERLSSSQRPGRSISINMYIVSTDRSGDGFEIIYFKCMFCMGVKLGR